jgi:hypothetical protein
MKTLGVVTGLALSLATPAGAADIAVSGVEVGGVRAALLVPATPRGALVLLAGGDGDIGVGADGGIARPGNFLVRTRAAFAAEGFATLVPDADVDVPAAVKFMARYGAVTLVGTSRGTLRAAQGLAEGARPAKLVLTSGFLTAASGDARQNVVAILGTAAALPPTLVVYHRRDTCRVTLPAGVEPFVAWAGGRARATGVDGGTSVGPACQARAFHGFNGVETRVVGLIAAFAR